MFTLEAKQKDILEHRIAVYYLRTKYWKSYKYHRCCAIVVQYI